MEKKQSGTKNLKTKRNSLFYKTIQRNIQEQFQQLPNLVIEQQKTIKIQKRVANNFPVLNFFSSQADQGYKCFSLQHKRFKKFSQKRQKTTEIQRSPSLVSKQIIIEKLAQKLKNENNLCHQKKNQEFYLPRIQRVGTSSQQDNLNLNLFEQKQKLLESKRNKSKFNIRCKILLANKCTFPFSNRSMGQNSQNYLQTKNRKQFQKNNVQNEQLFNLDVSRITQKSQISGELFFSQESMQQIPIF